MITSVDVSKFGEERLQSLLAEVRVTQRCLDGLVMRIGVRCNQLSATGEAAPTEDTIRSGGTVGSRQARRETTRARVAEQIEGLGDIASRGETSGEHVDSIARHTAKLTEEQRAHFDFADLVHKATLLPPETFDRLVKRRVDEATRDHGLGDATAKQSASEFRHWFDQSTGMGRFAGQLDPERYEALTSAIEQHMSAISAATMEPVAMTRNLAAQALCELVNPGGDGRRRLPSVTVIVDHATVATGPHDRSVRQTANGHDLAPESIARLCCDAVIRRVTVDGQGLPLDVGRKHRTATDAQWAVLKALHASCAWDACTAPIAWCQAHHIQEWERGGPTDLDNLIPLCSRHHHRVHEGRWKVKLLGDRTLEIFRPDGRHHVTVPAPQRC